MPVAPIPANEEARLKAVAAYRNLNSDSSAVYDDFTKIASYIADVPIALITFVDKDEQIFKARVGMDKEQTSRDLSFCAHAILNPLSTLQVEDATKDLRFADNPMVADDMKVRFYCGVPLVTTDSFALGTLCVIDKRPRILTKNQTEALEALARRIINRLEIHKVFEELDKAIHDPESHKSISSDVDDLTHKLGNLLLKKKDIQREFK